MVGNHQGSVGNMYQQPENIHYTCAMVYNIPFSISQVL